MDATLRCEPGLARWPATMALTRRPDTSPCKRAPPSPRVVPASSPRSAAARRPLAPSPQHGRLPCPAPCGANAAAAGAEKDCVAAAASRSPSKPLRHGAGAGKAADAGCTCGVAPGAPQPGSAPHRGAVPAHRLPPAAAAAKPAGASPRAAASPSKSAAGAARTVGSPCRISSSAGGAGRPPPAAAAAAAAGSPNKTAAAAATSNKSLCSPSKLPAGSQKLASARAVVPAAPHSAVPATAAAATLSPTAGAHRHRGDGNADASKNRAPSEATKTRSGILPRCGSRPGSRSGRDKVGAGAAGVKTVCGLGVDSGAGSTNKTGNNLEAKPGVVAVAKPGHGAETKPGGGAVTKLGIGMITKTASGVMMKPAGGLLIKLGIGSITKPGDGALTKPGSGLITKAASGVLTRPAGGVLTKSRGGAIAKPGDGALTKPGGGALVKAAGGAGARTAAPVSLSRKQEKEAANARLAEAVTRAEGAAANRRTAVSVQSAAGRTWSGGAPLRTVVAAPRPPAGCATGGGPRAPRRNCKAEAVAAARAQGAEHAGKLLQANGDAGGDAADTGDGETRAAAAEEEETARDASAEEKAEHDWSGQSKAERDESDTKADRDESEEWKAEREESHVKAERDEIDESKAERDESHMKAERDEIDESKAERDESHMKAERDEIDESKAERDESHMKAERDEIDESKTERDESHTKTKRDDCHMKAERDESGTKADHDESNESNMKAECGENGMKAEGDTKAERDESGTKAERDESDTKAVGDESGERKAECNESHMKTEHDENGTKAEGDTKAERDESGTKADSGEMKAESDMREKIITLSDELGAPKAAFDSSEETKSTYKTGEKAACGSREEETVDVDASGGRTEAATCDLGGGAKTRCAGLGQAGATHRASEPTTAGFDAGQEMKTPGAATDDASDGVPPAADAAGAEAVCDVSVFPGAIPKLNGVGEALPDARGAEDGSPLPRPSTKDAGSADTFGPRRLVSKTPAAVPSGLTDLGMSPVAEDKAAKGDDVLRAEAGARAGPGASLGDVRAAAPPRADVVRVQVHSHEHVGDAREGTGSDTEMKPAARAGVDENGALSRHVHGARFLAGAGPGVLLAELGLREINLSEAADEASSPSLPDGGGGALSDDGSFQETVSVGLMSEAHQPGDEPWGCGGTLGDLSTPSSMGLWEKLDSKTSSPTSTPEELKDTGSLAGGAPPASSSTLGTSPEFGLKLKMLLESRRAPMYEPRDKTERTLAERLKRDTGNNNNVVEGDDDDDDQEEEDDEEGDDFDGDYYVNNVEKHRTRLLCGIENPAFRDYAAEPDSRAVRVAEPRARGGDPHPDRSGGGDRAPERPREPPVAAERRPPERKSQAEPAATELGHGWTPDDFEDDDCDDDGDSGSGDGSDADGDDFEVSALTARRAGAAPSSDAPSHSHFPSGKPLSPILELDADDPVAAIPAAAGAFEVARDPGGRDLADPGPAPPPAPCAPPSRLTASPGRRVSVPPPRSLSGLREGAAAPSWPAPGEGWTAAGEGGASPRGEQEEQQQQEEALTRMSEVLPRGRVRPVQGDALSRWSEVLLSPLRREADACVTAVAAFSPDGHRGGQPAPGGPAGEWTIVELESHH